MQRLMEKVARRLKGDRIERCFTCWLNNVHEIRRQRSVLKRISARMKNRRAFTSFNRWNQFVDERYEQRKLVGKVFNRLLKGKISAGWTTWLDYLKSGRRIDRLMKRVAMRMKGASLIYCFERWTATVHNKHAGKIMVKKVLFRLKNRNLFSAWKVWHLHTLEEKYTAIYKDKIVELAVGMYNTRVLQKTFSTWRRLANHNFLQKLDYNVKSLEQKLHKCELRLYAQRKQIEENNSVQQKALESYFKEEELEHKRRSSIQHAYEAARTSIHSQLQEKAGRGVPFILGGKHKRSTNRFAKIQNKLASTFNNPQKPEDLGGVMLRARDHAISVLSRVHRTQFEDNFSLEDQVRPRLTGSPNYFTPTAKQIYAELDLTPQSKQHHTDYVERSKYQKLERALRDLLSLLN